MNLDIESGQSTRYMQVYDYYKELILTRKLPENTKMPSIRRCSEQLGLSRTTIETLTVLTLTCGEDILRAPFARINEC